MSGRKGKGEDIRRLVGGDQRISEGWYMSGR